MGKKFTTILILKLYIKRGSQLITKGGVTNNIQNHWIGRRLKGLPIEAVAGRLELILIIKKALQHYDLK
jgi:hypothetical protein